MWRRFSPQAFLQGEGVSANPRFHDEYTVGWICALPIELDAAKAMLDNIHPSLPIPAADENAYTLGSIGGHNVVIACLPKQTIGTTAAAKVVTQMQCTFAVKIGLLVGVGGGIPSKLKLGDVVVGTEWVQWDFGRVVQGGFQQTSKRNTPPNNLLTAISKLRALRRMDRAKGGEKYFKFAINTFAKFHPSLRGPRGFTLLMSTLLAPATSRIRPARVRYGLIASGNRVIKDAGCRDEIDRSLGGDVLCIEMEAAGLLNFPYIPIRGICDYADSRKNDDWQQYAAAAAAGYARELLESIHPEGQSIKSFFGRLLMSLPKDGANRRVFGTLMVIFGTLMVGFPSRVAECPYEGLYWLSAVNYSSGDDGS
ncbi:hypothetical protein AOL_s00210g193 [Orbilia oligospora ATCC 24927]|uniref:Nucleoside phosphorylase domain-containing protein n=1 Tax=Arthrobotrys oligospora (strain ATCC 24927 / CBS 115.81 / DSM 1491) TaxID=756982 RepID=G1XS35_ARTOA|nr:hypothetical protein AOL_s00210g193 [Orbilia oligospora ATCC 24927]EGX44032.1 hypothetical protein AOL_s00210g193 [Orbilia oligospora ATCC 24927]